MSEKIELLKCPACGGTLELQAGQTVLKCPYCNSAVMVPASAANARTPLPIDDANRAKIATLMRAGKKIDAIKLYRQLTNTDLAEAKDAVDAIERGG